MIRARELRVGNLVKCVMHLPIGFNAPALAYSEIVEIREGSVETNEGVFKYRNVGPLKLTEEILLRSGGKKTEEDLIQFETNEPRFPILMLLQENTLYYLSDATKAKFGAPFDSVHHFQNLYYILVGSEIRIRLR